MPINCIDDIQYYLRGHRMEQTWSSIFKQLFGKETTTEGIKDRLRYVQDSLY